MPEVETIKKGLQRAIIGKKITQIKVLRKKSFQGRVNKIIGKKVKNVSRRAKLLIIELEKKTFLVIHLKMTGQLIFKNKKQKEKQEKNSSVYDVHQLPNNYTRVIICFTDRSQLFFNDLRVFGWIKVVEKNKLADKEKARLDQVVGKELGPEPFSLDFSQDYLKKILASTKRAVKLVLTDQKKIAGIGNIYANEALFSAGIDPRTPAEELASFPKKVAKLYQSIKEALRLGIKHQGTTALDDAFRNLEGERGKTQNYLKVYGREGKKCFSCSKKIKKIKLGGRGTFYCPKCQQ